MDVAGAPERMRARNRRGSPGSGGEQQRVVEDLLAAVGQDPLRPAPDLGDRLLPVGDVVFGAESGEVELRRVAAERLGDRHRLQPELAARGQQRHRHRWGLGGANREHGFEGGNAAAGDDDLERLLGHRVNPAGNGAFARP